MKLTKIFDAFTCPELPKHMEESWRRTDPEMFFVPQSDVVCPDGKAVSENSASTGVSPWKVKFVQLSSEDFSTRLKKHFCIDSVIVSENAFLVEINDVFVQVFEKNNKANVGEVLEVSSKALSETFGAVAPNAEGRSFLGATLTQRLEEICGFQLQLNLKNSQLSNSQKPGEAFVVVSEECQFSQSHLILNVATQQNSVWNLAVRQYGNLQNHIQYRIQIGENSSLGNFFLADMALGSEGRSDKFSDAVSLTERKIELASNSKLVDGLVAVPCGEHRFISNICFSGERASAHCAAAVLNSGYAHFDYEPIHEHVAPSGTSMLNCHFVVQGTSRTDFQGLVSVETSAPGTDAIQLNKNLILNKSARVDSLPRLKILPNEVSCKHGSASGELDKNALYYLTSRGFSESESKQMLISSFAAEPFVKQLNQSRAFEAQTQFVQNLGADHVAKALLAK